jgi:hypothetical protein
MQESLRTRPSFLPTTRYWWGEPQWAVVGDCPGVRADGFNKFLISYEAWRDSAATANPGRLNAYTYHPDQRDIWGDHFFPTGIVLPFSSVPFDFGVRFAPAANRITRRSLMDYWTVTTTFPRGCPCSRCRTASDASSKR